MGDKKPLMQNKFTLAIIIVAALLVIALALLLVVLFVPSSDDSVCHDNVVGQETQINSFNSYGSSALVARPTSIRSALLASGNQEQKLTLSWWTGYDGEKTFKVENMLPGDAAAKQYKITVKAKNAVGIVFEAQIKKDSALSKILQMKVEANGTTLYDGALKEMSPLEYALQKGLSSQEVTYTITVSLPTSAGNEYAGLSLTLDFVWTLSETEPPVETTPEETTPVVTPPDTTPEETTPVVTPPDTTPEETTPVVTPPDTTPEETTPVVTPPDTTPEETTPVVTPPDTTPEETTPVVTPPDTTPPETIPPETTPVVTPPVVTTPAETIPVVTTPADTTPDDTTPVVTTPDDTTPVITPPDTTPVDTTPVDTTPGETTPPDTEPVDPPVDKEHCERCFVDVVMEKLFGYNGKRCAICNLVTALIGRGGEMCICPWGCLLFILILILLIVLLIFFILWLVFKDDEDEEEQEQDDQTPDSPAEISENTTEQSNDSDDSAQS